MGKLTKAQMKAHDNALAVLSLSRTLTNDDREFVYRNYNPMATTNVAKDAVFFTPLELAHELAIFGTGDNFSYVDLCAGIGALSYAVIQIKRDSLKSITCIEKNSEFVEIGRKLLPAITWICGDVFDFELLKSIGTFDVGIANPPYGNIKSDKSDWLLNIPAHLQIAEVMLYMCEYGGELIIPSCDTNYDLKRGMYQESKNLKKLTDKYPGISIYPESVDTSFSEDDWVGVNPDISIACLYIEDMMAETPFMKYV